MRAKVTGVTVAILTVGLFASGIATLGFVRNALITAQAEQLQERAQSNLAQGLLDIDVDEQTRDVKIRLTDQAAASDYYVAVYEPGGGTLVLSMPDSGGPNWPETFELERTVTQGTTPFTLHDEDGGAWQASAGTLDLDVNAQLYTQVIALPLATIDRTVAIFFGAFTVLAFVTVLAGAFLTRFLVTQTFRPLGQVEIAATAISAGDFGQRLTPGDPSTEVGKLTAALNTMLDRVDASLSQRDATVRQMRRFIGDASHELRTPLVTVRGYSELYRMGAIRGDEDTAQAMERIEKEAIRMGRMVEDLLALARLDESREVAFAAVDLRPLARDAAMDLRVSSPQRTVTVTDLTANPLPPLPPLPPPPAAADGAAEESPAPARRRGVSAALTGAIPSPRSILRRVPRPGAASRDGMPGDPSEASPVLRDATGTEAHGLPPVVLGDEDRIRQVIANLLGNARRFTPDDSPIDITVGVDPTRRSENAPRGMGWIAISDHGEGIPEQIRANIFERFWRADTSRTRETGGTGLGLAIVASVVDSLHGSVEVDDTPGGGATFRVFFPIARESTLYLDTQPLPKLTGLG